MAKGKAPIQHLKCCERSSTYQPNIVRTHPFKWIHFPIFVGIWFILFWFIICPIVWSKVYSYSLKHKDEWPEPWPYYFWKAALLIFFIILIILVIVWRCCTPKSKTHYENVFLNPEYGDEKEILCIHCMSFHPPGGAKCPCMSEGGKNLCGNCGKTKESFGTCCQKSKIREKTLLQGPPFEVTLRRQQPDAEKLPRTNQRQKSVDNKRNSLRSVKSGNSSSSNIILISSHDVGTKDLLNRNKDVKIEPLNISAFQTKSDNVAAPKDHANVPEAVKGSVKSRKPPNLQPVDVELANRHSNVEFFGDKIPLGAKKPDQAGETKVNTTSMSTPSTADAIDSREGSVGSMQSMDNKKFNQYLHLVEINTPFSPEDTVEEGTNVAKSPLSPREIFFYDLIQSAENSNSGNSPDSTHFGSYHKLEKKRPVSHILMASDVKFEDEIEKPKVDVLKRHTIAHVKQIDVKRSNSTGPKENLESPRILALTESIKLHASTGDEDEEKTIVRADSRGSEKKTIVKILRTVKKSTTEADALAHPAFADTKLIVQRSSSLSTQTSTHDIDNPRKESVSRFFIKDLRGPPKPVRQNSVVEQGRGSGSSAVSNRASGETVPDNDDVFSE